MDQVLMTYRHALLFGKLMKDPFQFPVISYTVNEVKKNIQQMIINEL